MQRSLQGQDLEELVLSGRFFSTSRSSSPLRSPSRSRSPSPDRLWPADGNSVDSDLSTSPQGHGSELPNGVESIGMGPGRTGVKGVIRDHREAMSMEQAKMAQQIKKTNRRMEKMALSARTYAEEEEERILEKRREEGHDADRAGRRHFERTGWFGHLREVGMSGFLDAVENEMSQTWVLIHIYDPSLPRCHDLDAILARLARQYPQTKFLRARASAVDFFSSAYPHPSTTQSQQNLITISENASYSDGEDDSHSFEEVEDGSGDATDMEMLPTLLAYRAGELVHTWVRVDWEAEEWTKRENKGKSTHGSEGIVALLQGHYVIQSSGNGNCGFSSDEDDLSLQFTRDANLDDKVFDM